MAQIIGSVTHGGFLRHITPLSCESAPPLWFDSAARRISFEVFLQHWPSLTCCQSICCRCRAEASYLWLIHWVRSITHIPSSGRHLWNEAAGSRSSRLYWNKEEGLEAAILFYLLPLHQHQKHLERLSQCCVMFAAFKQGIVNKWKQVTRWEG